MSHQTISFIKSFFRIGGYLILLVSPMIGVGWLVVSELWGIVEEIGEK